MFLICAVKDIFLCRPTTLVSTKTMAMESKSNGDNGSSNNITNASHKKHEIVAVDSNRSSKDELQQRALLRRTASIAAAGRATTHAPTSEIIDYPSSTSDSAKPVEAIQQHQSHRDPLFFYSSLVAGIGSGSVSSFICAPLDLLRTRIQVWGDVVDNNKKKSDAKKIVQMIRTTIRTEGIAGCFRGLTATLMTVPTFWGVYCT